MLIVIIAALPHDVFLHEKENAHFYQDRVTQVHFRIHMCLCTDEFIYYSIGHAPSPNCQAVSI